MVKPAFFETCPHAKTALIGVQAPYNRTPHIDAYYKEFIALVETRGNTYDATTSVTLRNIDPAYFFTRGKLEQIASFCTEHAIEELIISEPLTGQQERNLSEFLDCTITDRTKLILDIFKNAAHSAEGKKQVEIALLEYKKTRLTGKGIHMSQQSGAIGLRSGPGETAKEREKRTIDTHIKRLKRELVTLQKTRATQRKKRLASGVPHICLIGYTNAGKSTILNLLTHSSVLAEDKLFATLDTTTRELYINGLKKGIISDTVGFIQLLPHNLIEAFKSTLSELHHADLLIHVIDSSDPNWKDHIAIVHDILQELSVDKEILYVFNKIDAIDGEIAYTDFALFRPHLLTSATSKDGIRPLIDFLHEWHGHLQKNPVENQ